MLMAREIQLPTLLQFRAQELLVRQIDEWRRTQVDIPSRSEAVRRLIEKALASG